MNEKKCFHCQSPETVIPLVRMSFKGNELWICPRCIPSLIHEPEIVQASLEKNSTD